MKRHSYQIVRGMLAGVFCSLASATIGFAAPQPTDADLFANWQPGSFGSFDGGSLLMGGFAESVLARYGTFTLLAPKSASVVTATASEQSSDTNTIDAQSVTFDANLFNVAVPTAAPAAPKTSQTSTQAAAGAPKYFDTAAGDGNGVGGNGTLSAQTTALYSNSATGDATLSAAAATDDGIFQGTPGTVTFATNYALNSATFNVSGYVLTANSTTARVFSAPITLATGVNLSLIEASQTADRTLGIGSVSGGSGSTLTIQGAQTGTASSRINLAVANSTISVPTTISGSGTSLAGYVATAAGQNITNTITNNSGFTTLLGATSGNDLTLSSAAIVSGSAGVQFSAGSSGGAGPITINSVNTYLGPTTLNNSATGVVRLGVNNALPDTALQFGVGSNNTGALDLNGTSQRVASIATTGSGTVNGIVNTSANQANLTIDGSTSTVYSSIIGIPANVTNLAGANNNISVTRSGSGTQTFSGANTYTGGTAVTGGTLLVTNTTGSGTGTGAVTVTNSGSTFGGGTTTGVGGVSGPVTVGSGANLSPGSATGNTGILQTGALTLQMGSNYLVNINGATAGTQYDQTSVTGLVDVTGSILTTTLGSGFTPTNQPFVIVSNDGTDAVTGMFANSSVLPAGYTIDYMYDSGTGSLTGGNDIALVAVPEPSTWAAGVLAVAALGFMQRRRVARLLKRSA